MRCFVTRRVDYVEMETARTRPMRAQSLNEYDYLEEDPAGFEIKQVNAHVGLGLFAEKPIPCGHFIVNYRGKTIDYTTLQDLDERKQTYVFYYKHEGKNFAIDASDPDSGIARYINDVDFYTNANCRPKRRLLANEKGGFTVLIAFFAVADIKAGKLFFVFFKDLCLFIYR